MNILEFIGNVLAILGALVFASAALGINRFPDTYTRLSAVGTAGGLGISLVITGAILHQPSVPGFIMLALIIGLQLATSSVGSIMIGRSAYLTGSPLVRPHFNDLESDSRVQLDSDEEPQEDSRAH